MKIHIYIYIYIRIQIYISIKHTYIYTHANIHRDSTDSTRDRSENKKCEEHGRIQMEKAGGRTNRKVIRGTKQEMTTKTKATTIAEDKWERNKYRNVIVTL